MQSTEHRTQNTDRRETGITKAQIKLIHTLKTKLGLSDDDYRLLVQGIHGFSSTSKDLTYNEASKLITDMKRMAHKAGTWTTRPKKYDNLGHRPGMASPAQLRMVEVMWSQVSYTHDPATRESALRKFIFRQCKKSAMEFLEGRDISKLVRSMKAMKGQKR
ncbi:MAG: regulatory protein GemA [Nitrospiraceae bacterium]|nr:MAG: regulatory protein GemA [Nitrospiraceae bacterium]